MGMNLLTKPEEIYLSLIEATAYGTRMIIEQFEDAGVPVNALVLSGGIPAKNKMLVQIYSDVCNKEIRISGTDQASALGAAILGIAIIQNLYNDAGMAPLMIIASVPLYNIMAVTVLSFLKPGDHKMDRSMILETLKGIATTHDKLVSILIMLGSATTVSCYIMAKNMGHEGSFSSSVIMLTTLLSAFTLTGWLFLCKSLGLI